MLLDRVLKAPTQQDEQLFELSGQPQHPGAALIYAARSTPSHRELQQQNRISGEVVFFKKMQEETGMSI